MQESILVEFLIKSLSLLADNGILSFILPKSFLNCLYYDKTRKYIYENYKILHISECKDDYLDTQQETIIFIIQNTITPSNVENKNNPLQLIFETSINKKSLLLDSSGEAKRMQIEFEVNYSIFKVGEYKELAYSNTVNVFNTYTLSISEYNNSRAEIKTYDLIAKEIGSIIVNQISMNYLQLMD